jgi:hypothetical protein
MGDKTHKAPPPLPLAGEGWGEGERRRPSSGGFAATFSRRREKGSVSMTKRSGAKAP